MPLPAKGLSYSLEGTLCTQVEVTKHPGPPFASPTGRNKAATPQVTKWLHKYFVNWAFLLTFVLQMKYMVKESGLHQLINDDDQFLWLNPSIKQGENSNTKGSQYYSQLDRQTILELYHRFRIDHEMFDYSIQPYLSYAKSKVEL